MTASSTALSEVIGEVSRRARPDSRFSLFLDFDGTLVPIAANPDTPRLDDDTRDTIRRIASKEWCVTTIISGRAIDDLYPRIRLNDLIYAGNHGLEIRARGLTFLEPGAAACRERLHRISGDLAKTLGAIAGVFVEDKGLSASVHYRQAAAHDVERVEDAVQCAVARAGDCFRMNSGKKVFEIVPRTAWHKGAAAQWINRQFGLEEERSIFLGDDTTDEDAFATLTKAITVEVGDSDLTGAHYQLPGPESVHEFLVWMAGFEIADRAEKPFER